ncbi:hypothetical protein C8R46DRAFT_1065522 [Mycena filopes]|nr:hypothetical protein C8R46DRAFT_1065522 [Mycena filopes]
MLPQELFNAIVHELADERQALKACALSASVLRRPSQEALFRALFLGHGTSDFRIAWNLLQESPHIADYVKSLIWILSARDVAADEHHAMFGVLNTLTCVRRFCILSSAYVGGNDPLFQPWPVVAPLPLAFIDFIRRRKLAELLVTGAGPITRGALSFFLGGVKTLALLQCDITDTLDDAPHPLPAFPVKNLFLLGCPGLMDVLASEEYLSRITVERLWLAPQQPYGDILVSRLAPQLAHIRLACKVVDYFKGRPALLPDCQFPRLQTVVIDLDFTERDAPGFIEFIEYILAHTPPNLREICVCYLSMKETWPSTSLAPETTTGVDSLLAAASQRPLIRWRLEFADGAENSFGEFARNLRRGLPVLDSTGRLIIERFKYLGATDDHWPRIA